MTTKENESIQIINTIKSKGFEAYLVGGCVRDKLLNQNPLDFDIATSALPQDITKIFRRTISVGAKFGVIIVMIHENQYEVATFRADDRYIDGRRPETVRFVSKEEDVKRRDFTINGLLEDTSTGEILDLVKGQEDLRNKIIRTIGIPENRFKEDHLRMMRAIRFAARLNYKIEEKTWEAIKVNCKLIKDISPERIKIELEKSFTGPNPDRALILLNKSGLLKELLPEVHNLIGIEQPKEFHPEGDVFIHTLKLFQIASKLKINLTETLAFSILLHDIGKKATFRIAKDRIRFNNHNIVGAKLSTNICKRLKFSKKSADTIYQCVENHMNFINVTKMRPNKLIKFIRRDTFEEEIILHKLDCLASHGDDSNCKFLLDKKNEFGEEKIKPIPLITGRELIHLGFKPSPIFKEIIQDVENMQLDEKISSKTEAIEYIIKNYSSK